MALFWLLLWSAVNTIGLAVYGIIQYGTLPVIAHAILSIATTIVVSAFVVIKYGFKQVQKHVVVRTYSEYTDEKHETCAKMKIHLLLAALINVITNAHEAGAEKIEVIVGKRSVTVRDNGPGFDVSKLKLGWTTKKNGHGVGLCTSIDALESCCVATEIESKQGAGTSISFVFSEDIVAYPSQS